MDMKSRKNKLLLLTLCLALTLCGCRTRTNGGGQQSVHSPAGISSGAFDDTREGESLSVDAVSPALPETGPGDENTGEFANQTKENPNASRKEYDENAPAEIVPGTDRLLHAEGEGNGAPVPNDASERSAGQLNEQAEETASQTAAADAAEQMGVSEDAEAADSAMTYFTVLVQDRMGSLFECQRQNVYWETARDHGTIHKSSPEHALILNAGCYDVSARLLPENLTVDDGWVMRKNPGVIIKIVESSVLGSGVSSTGAAESVYQRLQNREGWASMDAVKNRRILLLSQELLEAPYLQTAVLVMIAKTANPSLFTDVDLDEMLRMLTEEATGTLPAGMYYFKEE